VVQGVPDTDPASCPPYQRRKDNGMATTIHAGDCINGCDTCRENYHNGKPDIFRVYDEDSILGDAYYCGLCNELLQVG